MKRKSCNPYCIVTYFMYDLYYALAIDKKPRCDDCAYFKSCRKEVD